MRPVTLSPMRYIVNGSPEECAEKTEAFFALHWSHGGQYRRNTNTVSLMREEPHSRILDFAKMVVSFGIFGALGAPMSTIQASFVNDDGRTVAILTASREDFADEFREWAIKELDAQPV